MALRYSVTMRQELLLYVKGLTELRREQKSNE
jgi:hypothetical protein